MKKSELTQLIKESYKEILLERKLLYPNQDEAENLLAWKQATENLTFTSEFLSTAFKKAENLRMNVWDKVFGDTSPWSVKRKGNKYEVVWDKAKATKLGLDED